MRPRRVDSGAPDRGWTVEELALARVLEECLAAMEQGETDLDALAGRYPEAKDELRSLLEVAATLRARREVLDVPLDFLRELKERLTKEAALS